MLVGLGIDAPLGEDSLRLVGVGRHEIYGGELFAGGAPQALAVDGDRGPAVAIGLPLQPSTHGRLEGVDVDGTTVSMPDTPENQMAFPQMKAQEPGLGSPLV